MRHRLYNLLFIPVLMLILPDSTCLAQTSGQKSQMEKNIEAARIMIPQKQYEEALTLLSKVIRNNPNNYQAYLLRSQAKYGLQDYLGSMNDAQEILAERFKADSNSIFIAHHNIGTCYNNLGLYEKAITSLNLAKSLNSSDVSVHFSLSYSYMQLQVLDSAIVELDALLKLAPKDKRGYYGKGKVYIMKEKYQEAILEFDKAIDVDANYVMAYQNRGEAKRLIGDNAGSCSDWQKCVELGLEDIKPYLKMVCQ